MSTPVRERGAIPRPPKPWWHVAVGARGDLSCSLCTDAWLGPSHSLCNDATAHRDQRNHIRRTSDLDMANFRIVPKTRYAHLVPVRFLRQWCELRSLRAVLYAVDGFRSWT
jgi:hypothetical protein